MSAHIKYPNIDNKIATTSSKLLSELLRDKWGFEGIVLTDEFAMGALVKSGDLGEMAINAINAGCDMILACQLLNGIPRAEDLYQAVLEAVYNGRISEDRLNESVRRILTVKAKLFTDYPNLPKWDSSIFSSASSKEIIPSGFLFSSMTLSSLARIILFILCGFSFLFPG